MADFDWRPFGTGSLRRDRAGLWLKAAVTQYQASPEWRRLAARTMLAYGAYLDHWIERFRGCRLAWLDREEIIPLIYVWRDEMQGTPGYADNHLTAVSAFLTWAKRRRMLRHNWVREIERLRQPRSRAELIWEAHTWDRLLGAAAEDERRLLRFALFSAARKTDCCRLRKKNFEAGWLTFKPQKTPGVTVRLPVYAFAPFAELVAEISAVSDPASPYLLTTGRGFPWTASTITTRMVDLKLRAFAPGEIPARTFHDIRGTTVTRLFAAGCSEAEVNAITGHSLAQGSAQSYAQRSRQLALNAYNRWTAAEFSGGKIVEFRR